ITANQEKIIHAIKENPFVTQEELSQIVGIAKLNINKNMKKLQEQNLIERIGADKNGKWVVCGEGN
ncbi:MAG: helix-turn-helix domain-containing protein, partial [Erysipelotrichaceae bacterium]|nr:helix-turn-helix domain-containing protein [Erysipelotrichaceae bacterium]